MKNRIRRSWSRALASSRVNQSAVCLAIISLCPVNGVQAQQNSVSANFHDVANQVGLQNYEPSGTIVHGPGAVFVDFNNDGYPDIYAVDQPVNSLYLNVAAANGLRTFQSVAGAAGANPGPNSSAAAPADYDNDGDLDLFVAIYDGPNFLYKNMLTETGSLQFQNVTAQTVPSASIAGTTQAGLAQSFDSTGEDLSRSYTASWGDVNRDGFLDLFIGTHNGLHGNNPIVGGTPGMRDTLYLNQGDGTFLDVTEVYEVTGALGPNGETGDSQSQYNSSMASIFVDINNDSWPDLIVSNKTRVNNRGSADLEQLYINNGANAAGVWQGFDNVTHTLPGGFISPDYSRSPMSMVVADIDNDGDLDITYSDDSATELNGTTGTNELLINQLSETGQLSFTVNHTSVPAGFSWGTVFTDFDNNGYEDLFVSGADCCTRGFNQPDWLYMNAAGQFVDQITAANISSNVNTDGRGNASADYDRDGWQDLLQVYNDGSNANLYRNASAILHPSRGSVSVKLVGNPNAPSPYVSSADAIGARVTLLADLNGSGNVAVNGGERQIREVASGYNVMSSTSSLEVDFGMGLAVSGTLQVQWPSGRNTSHTVSANKHYILHETQGLNEISFNNNVLANPQPIPGYVFCATEGSTCALPGPATVRYGANGQYSMQSFEGGNVACTNQQFGDPINGTAKFCEYLLDNPAPSASGYVFCANEGATCSVPGPATVRYGANGQYFELFVNGGSVECTNGQFGDPINGIVKSCEYMLNSAGAFVPDPNKLYHIDNPAHGLRLAATGNSEVLESRTFASTGEDTQWQFIQSATSGLWHIQRAAGGSTPRIRTVLTTTPDMQATSSSGDWTRFSITANADRPGTYLLTVPLANTQNQRLRLLSSGATDFSTNNNTGSNPSFVFTEVEQQTGGAFVPDPNKLYHIDNPAHGLRLAATANSEVLESRTLASSGVNTQWQFVQSATSGLWHIQRAAGGSTPRIRTVLTTTPDMQSTGSSGVWTRFSITPNAERPGTYLLTVPLANTQNQRLSLLSSGATDFSTNNNTGSNPSFIFTEVN